MPSRLENDGHPGLVAGRGALVPRLALRPADTPDRHHAPSPGPRDALEFDPPTASHVAVGDAKVEALGRVVRELIQLRERASEQPLVLGLSVRPYGRTDLPARGLR